MEEIYAASLRLMSNQEENSDVLFFSRLMRIKSHLIHVI